MEKYEFIDDTGEDETAIAESMLGKSVVDKAVAKFYEAAVKRVIRLIEETKDRHLVEHKREAELVIVWPEVRNLLATAAGAGLPKPDEFDENPKTGASISGLKVWFGGQANNEAPSDFRIAVGTSKLSKPDEETLVFAMAEMKGNE